MELIVLFALLLILYVVYTLFSRETFISSSENRINTDIHNYYTRKRGGGLSWNNYRDSEKSYDKFKVGNSSYN